MEGRNGYSCGCYPGWGGRDCVHGKSIQKLPSVVIEEICCCNFSVSRLNLYLFYNSIPFIQQLSRLHGQRLDMKKHGMSLQQRRN